jgi:hypothetical protein
LLVLGLPAAVGGWVWRRRKGTVTLGSGAVWLMFAAILGFGVLRNLPWPLFRYLNP